MAKCRVQKNSPLQAANQSKVFHVNVITEISEKNLVILMRNRGIGFFGNRNWLIILGLEQGTEMEISGYLAE